MKKFTNEDLAFWTREDINGSINTNCPDCGATNDLPKRDFNCYVDCTECNSLLFADKEGQLTHVDQCRVCDNPMDEAGIFCCDKCEQQYVADMKEQGEVL